MPNTINTNQLTPGAAFLVRGKVGFSRITRPTTDEERERENKRRMYPQLQNYTNISIYEAEVLAINPSQPTIEERYAAECLYRSTSQNYPGNNFSAMNKTRNLPTVGVLEGSGKNYVEIKPQAELATGLDVTLVLRVYRSPAAKNNGVSLERVLVNEPIRYYGGNNEVDKMLADFGITFRALPPQADNQTADGVPIAAAEAASASDKETTNTTAFAPMNNEPTPATAQPTNVFVTANQPTVQPMVQPQPTPAAPANPFSAYSAAPNNMQFTPGNRQY